MSLGVFAPVFEWVEQLGIQTCQASQILGIDLITRLDDYAQRPLKGEAPPEGLGAGTQPTLLHNLTASLVDEAQVAVFVAEVQSGCHLWLLFATIHCGPILLPGR
jgi:hypothetical protein